MRLQTLGLLTACLSMTTAVAQVPDDSILVAGTAGPTSILLTGTGTSIAASGYGAAGYGVSAAAVATDGRIWFRSCVYNDSGFIGISPPSPDIVYDQSGLCQSTTDLTARDDGTLLVLSQTGSISIFDPASGTVTPYIESPVDPGLVTFDLDQDGGMLTMAIGTDGSGGGGDSLEGGEGDLGGEGGEGGLGNELTTLQVRVIPLSNPSAAVTHILPGPSGARVLALPDGGFVTTAYAVDADSFVLDRYDAAGQRVYRTHIAYSAVDLDLASDGYIWVLGSDRALHRYDLLDGQSPDLDGSYYSSWYGAETLDMLLFVDFDMGEGPAVVDECPDNPNKTSAGVCGCDYDDVDAASDGPGTEGTACVHYTAGVDLRSVSFGSGAVVEPGAIVQAGATLGADVLVAPRAEVGAGAIIGDRTIVSRRATVEANTVIGADSVIGRSARVGTDTTIGDDVIVGYGTDTGDNTSIGNNVTLGDLVSLAGDNDIGGNALGGEGPTIIARGVQIGAGFDVYAGAVIGPETLIGSPGVIEQSVRIRKQVTIGDNVHIRARARIGRGDVLHDACSVLSDANLNAYVTVQSFQCVPAGATVPRSTTVSDSPCAL